MEQNQSIICAYALSFVGRPYIWGGKNPLKGFDCSGLVCELLHAAGILHGETSLSAQTLFTYLFHEAPSGKGCFGALAFYGKDYQSIEHVGFGVSDLLMISASGGDSKTTDLAEATSVNAFVKVRPYKYRRDLLDILVPKYAFEGS